MSASPRLSAQAGAASVGGSLDGSGVDALKDRYYDWIVTPGKDAKGANTKTPQEVWETSAGAMLREKFNEIGRLAAEGAGTGLRAGGSETNAAADRVEAANDCDWCRKP